MSRDSVLVPYIWRHNFLHIPLVNRVAHDASNTFLQVGRAVVCFCVHLLALHHWMLRFIRFITGAWVCLLFIISDSHSTNLIRMRSYDLIRRGSLLAADT